jgi:hypothetical protein
LRPAALTASPLLVAALLTSPAPPLVCRPGWVEQVLIWPGGDRDLVCAALPPDPSNDE